MGKGQRKVDWSLDLENMRVRAGQFVSETMGEPVEAKHVTLQEELDGVQSAQVAIDFSIGRATVRALAAGSPLLFRAALNYIGELDYAVSGSAERFVSLRQKSGARDLSALVSKENDLHWDIALAQGIPFTLQLKGGVGESRCRPQPLAGTAIAAGDRGRPRKFDRAAASGRFRTGRCRRRRQDGCQDSGGQPWPAQAGGRARRR